ncbi:TPA: CDP-glycerol glycerophosphotransferase family protein [Campylobacter jejuni]|uniref:CDP-glycerol glycerophosphotransferase family protein n=1 Tax=Campylobacter jejuni TaxID=197 RepID=UPI000257F7CF|nr:CDP-glycerol glycerophosphotransferase family protein [Campylobacter jejuni]EIB25199.1 CDP-glycerol:poly(glycerophosphate) glycerophosphotransferase, putative [Campylobacter jejuni subsp. jejuni LMG 23223]MDP8441818.1 CDP-glycerol glycerophosphotransferase family protein [Campylobacter jejuni]HED5019709.1 CDP-glycerol glycerophosphotransferase family protein [Campylobacter jejuni]HEF8487091.1 CDP-glycerol glycerophosphotransferase family protein [Campylobacter jejuni]
MFFLFYYIYGVWLYHKKKFSQAKCFFIKTIEKQNNNAQAYFKLGMCYFKLCEWKEANEYIAKALILCPSKISWNIQLKQTENHLNSMISIPQKLWWKEVEDLKKYMQKKGGNFFIYKDLALALENMRRYQEAAKYYELAIKHSKTKDSYLYYKAGFCYERDGQTDSKLIKYLYANAIKYDDDLNSKILGIGIFHQSNKCWEEANKAYLDFYKYIKNSCSDVLLYNIAYSFEKLFNYQEAEKYYKKALELNYQECDFHYRLGIVLEKMAKYEEASIYYENTIKRSNTHRPFLYFRLCKCLNALEEYKKLSEILSQSQIIQNQPYGLSEDILKDKNLRRRVFYTECYKNLKIIDNMILYESFHGKSMSCNPYAIFLYLLEQNAFKDFTHIWVVNDLSIVKNKFKKMKNVICVKRGSDLYLKYLASAKYLINNSTFPEYFIRKMEQLYLNTWHGIPWKMLGKDIKGSFMEYKNVQRNFLHTTHLIAPSKHTMDVMIKSHEIEFISSSKKYLSGYPRVDISLNQTKSEKEELRSTLGIPLDKKVILYAPTFRGSFYNSENISNEKINELYNKVKDNFDEYCLIYRGHYSVNNNNNILDKNIIIPPVYIDTNELLGIVDVLITDYSSVLFDFMSLNRPIIFFLYDYDNYKNNRGLYFDISEISQEYCVATDDIINALKNINYSKILYLYDQIKDYYIIKEKGQATRLVVDFFFKDIIKNNLSVDYANTKKNILFYPGALMPNGITSSFRNLINTFNQNNYNIHISIDASSVEGYLDRIKLFNEIKDKILTIPSVGNINYTLEEYFVYIYFLEHNNWQNLSAKMLFEKIFKREFRRLYGDAKIDSLINFDGYTRYWHFLFAINNIKQKIVFLHNDMRGEFNRRFPQLEQNFRCYNFYDKIFSVSKQTNSENKKNLADLYGIEENKFDFLENMINNEDIIEKSKEKLDKKLEKKYFKKDYKIFINIARLSIEKDQAKLIQAFKVINDKYPKTLLLILGEGPLKEDLEKLIKDLKLDKKVFLLGRIFNPFPYLKKADCFVMSSNHEGQPMTLLEALVLNKAIVATDIPGNVSVLDNRGGLIVENNVNGLISGMERFLCGKIENKIFNYTQYNLKIMSRLNILLKGDNYE